MGIGAGIAKGIMGNQAKKDQFEENKQYNYARSNNGYRSRNCQRNNG
nr:MAG TPA: hypothetical protein [Microviridae sp.]